MPLDDTAQNDFLTNIAERMRIAGVINDPAGVSRFLMIRGYSHERRREIMSALVDAAV